ncbi:DNA polymerase III subunit gamma/tau [Desulfolucanica intricata]|uniref:DNA polymerase III subunit gamma/tau n=1 Tax=Desulfolucanica intricata TaxID=1285191 RepID=UPI000829E2E7|nr:DNA polymerase III subunit gamma/tau [Desulfolucanica intricata]
MTYRALYREWRPQYFYDIVGQKHVVLTLENAIKNNRIAHAYLFCGPRGTGKTSTAKILAKALNCLNLQGHEPCNECSVCQAISSGSSIDVIEIDAASNRGIDEIRELKEKVKFSPSMGKFKVYIIDEVHMLTNEAFNALLKTLEEPPQHVIFILATTEPQKVPLTILSRCQRFDFKTIPVDDIVRRLEKVLESLKIEISSPAVHQIARAAEGGLRDALSILDQIVTFGNRDKISEEDIHNLLGTVNKDTMNQVLEYLLKGDIGSILHLVSAISSEGKDLRLFVKEFINHIRELLLINIDPSLVDNENYDQKITFKSPFLLSILDDLIEYESKMKWSSQPRIILELAFIKMIHKQEKGDPVLELDKSTMEIKNCKIKSNQKHLLNKVPVNLEVEHNKPKPEQKNNPVSINRIKQAWKDVVKEVKQAKSTVSGVISNSFPIKIENQILTVGLEDDLQREWLDKQKNKDLIQQVLKSILGIECQVKFVNAKAKIQEEQVSKDSTTTSESIINLFEAKEIKN